MYNSVKRASRNETEAFLHREIHRIQVAAQRRKSKQGKDETFVCQAGLADIDELNQENLPNTLELSSMTIKCHFCGALGFKSEVNITSDGLYNFGSMCCKKGEVKIRQPPSVPPQTQELFILEMKMQNSFYQILENSILECQWLLSNSVICH